jgi:hypothetical protein
LKPFTAVKTVQNCSHRAAGPRLNTGKIEYRGRRQTGAIDLKTDLVFSFNGEDRQLNGAAAEQTILPPALTRANPRCAISAPPRSPRPI